MGHPLVLALFDTRSSAAGAARALHAIGVDRAHLSVVAKTYDESDVLAHELDAAPGADIEDSRAAARLGELGGLLVAAIALVLPGIGPIVTAGPLSAEFGMAAGHAAGSLSTVLARAGVTRDDAAALQAAVEKGAVLLAVHARADDLDAVRAAVAQSGARRIAIAEWTETSST
jgi:hypothetical protein